MKKLLLVISQSLLCGLFVITGAVASAVPVRAADNVPVVVTDPPSDFGSNTRNYIVISRYATMNGRVISTGGQKVRPGIRCMEREYVSDDYVSSPCSFKGVITLDKDTSRAELWCQSFVRYEVGSETITVWGNKIRFYFGNPPLIKTLGATFSPEALKLTGSAYPKSGSYSCDYTFEYGLTTEYGNTTPPQTPISMSWDILFSAELTGIEPGVYHFRARADTRMGWCVYGQDMVVDYRIPHTISANTATGVTSSSASLEGYVTSMGNSRSVSTYFEYGATPDYGKTAPAQKLTTFGPFSASLAGLSPATVYHYRAVGDGGGNGKVFSPDLTFTTEAAPPPPPTTSTAPAVSTTPSYPIPSTTAPSSTPPATTTSPTTTAPPTPATLPTQPVVPLGPLPIPPQVNTSGSRDITPESAVLTGYLVNFTSDAGTSVYFEYGTTSAFGLKTPLQTMAGPGSFSATLTGLSSNTTYYFRARAENAYGPSLGTGMSFTTASLPPATTVTNILTLGPIPTVSTPVFPTITREIPGEPPSGTPVHVWAVVGAGALAVMGVGVLLLRGKKR